MSNTSPSFSVLTNILQAKLIKYLTVVYNVSKYKNVKIMKEIEADISFLVSDMKILKKLKENNWELISFPKEKQDDNPAERFLNWNRDLVIQRLFIDLNIVQDILELYNICKSHLSLVFYDYETNKPLAYRISLYFFNIYIKPKCKPLIYKLPKSLKMVSREDGIAFIDADAWKKYVSKWLKKSA